MKEPMRPVNALIELADIPGFGMSVIDDPTATFPYVERPNVLPNPLFPHAMERARARTQTVVARYT